MILHSGELRLCGADHHDQLPMSLVGMEGAQQLTEGVRCLLGGGPQF